MNKEKGFNIKIFNNSIKFYLPRVEGYQEVIKTLSKEYAGMSLIEFDGYFEKRFEPVKYVRAEVHASKINKNSIITFANNIRKLLKQKSLAVEYNNKLILIEE